MINSYLDSLRATAQDIMNNWIAGELTDEAAICAFVKLILAGK